MENIKKYVIYSSFILLEKIKSGLFTVGDDLKIHCSCSRKQLYLWIPVASLSSFSGARCMGEGKNTPSLFFFFEHRSCILFSSPLRWDLLCLKIFHLTMLSFKPNPCFICSRGSHRSVPYRSGENPHAKPARHWLCGWRADVQKQLWLF